MAREDTYRTDRRGTGTSRHSNLVALDPANDERRWRLDTTVVRVLPADGGLLVLGEPELLLFGWPTIPRGVTGTGKTGPNPRRLPLVTDVRIPDVAVNPPLLVFLFPGLDELHFVDGLAIDVVEGSQPDPHAKSISAI
ncbi:MAG: hypothetical protein V5A62_17220 [Haloarculaceae archaeon]